MRRSSKLSGFKKREIGNGSTLAEQFFQARTAKDLTLKVCSEELNIQTKYLECLENSDFSLLPGEAYAKHWIREYADFLGLDPQNCLERYRQEMNITTELNKKEKADLQKVTRPPLIQILLTPRFLRLVAVVVAGVALVGYLSFFIFSTFQPPVVNFNEPLVDQQTQESNLNITGTTDPGVQIWFNDQTIVVDTNGQFSQTIPLQDGLNILTIRAKKKHSQEFVKTVQIVKTELPELINN